MLDTFKDGKTDLKVHSYDHCNSKEELEFEMYSNYVASGMLPEKAECLAKKAAEDLWNVSESLL